MDIKKIIKEAAEKLRINKLRKHQVKPINSIISGNDTFVIAPTSAGKSAIFQLPAIMHADTSTIVIEPTLALMHNQVSKLQDLNIEAAYIDSMMTPKEKGNVMMRMLEGEIRILYVSPERFCSEDFQYAFNRWKVSMVVVDESHCVFDWGYSFRDSYLRIGDTIDTLQKRPVISAFTATASPTDIKEICNLLHMTNPKVFVNNLYRKNLVYIKKSAVDKEQKKKFLIKYLRKYHKHSSIVYCNTHRAVEAVYEFLLEKYPDDVVQYHAGMSDHERTSTEFQFLSHKKSIMVATTAFGMGVDLDTLDLVIHFNMPLSLTDFMQQSGRAGRNGQKAHCVLLYSDEDYYTNRVILMEDIDRPPETKSEEHMLYRLNEMKEFCENREQCMVQMLLKTFGQHKKESCNRCTNCQVNRRGKDA